MKKEEEREKRKGNRKGREGMEGIKATKERAEKGRREQGRAGSKGKGRGCVGQRRGEGWHSGTQARIEAIKVRWAWQYEVKEQAEGGEFMHYDLHALRYPWRIFTTTQGRTFEGSPEPGECEHYVNIYTSGYTQSQWARLERKYM